MNFHPNNYQHHHQQQEEQQPQQQHQLLHHQPQPHHVQHHHSHLSQAQQQHQFSSNVINNHPNQSNNRTYCHLNQMAATSTNQIYIDSGNCLQINNNNNSNNSGISLNNKGSNFIFIQPNTLAGSGALASQITSSPSTTTIIPQPITNTANVLYSIQANNPSHYENYDHLSANDLNASFQIDVESFVANLANLEVDQNDCFQRIATDANQIAIQHNQHQLSNDVYKLQNGLDNELANVYNQSQSNSSLNQLSQQTLSINQQSSCLMPSYESNMEITKVDILNQVIQSSNNTSITDELDFEHHINYGEEDSSVATFRNRLKMRVKDDKINKIKCAVCGNKSSGFHYGAYTCEACKLFYRRAEKQLRKTTFNECKAKNCEINYKNRADCPECRYKKCIIVGMSMSRSRYGRHTDNMSTNGTYSTNISDSLCALITTLKANLPMCKDSNQFNDLIIQFYLNSLDLLNKLDTSSAKPHDRMLNNPSTQHMHKFLPNEHFKLPNSVLILFCVLFNLKFYINAINSDLNQILNDYEIFLQFVNENVLNKNEFGLILKIGLFLKMMLNLFERKKVDQESNALLEKRLNDLMRAEFTLFKPNDTMFVSFNNGSNSSHMKPFEQSHNVPNWTCLTANLNFLLFRHMNWDERKYFLNV